jgi:hypothetical protein
METLYVATCCANPLLWASREALARAAITDWLKEPNVVVYLAECAYGSRGYELADMAGARVVHIPLRATSMAWSKENLLNIAIAHMPQAAQKIATLDADVTFRQAGWATRVVQALDLYPVIQPWSHAIDLGPQDQVMQTFRSFAKAWLSGQPVAGEFHSRTLNGGPYLYPHPGYAWAWTRTMLDRTGGLFEDGGMGSGDHHMALGMIGQAQASLPPEATQGYKNVVMAWASRAAAVINGKLGYIGDTIEHPFHGRKGDRGYQSRWTMFLDNGFDPGADLKRNTWRVIEFAGNKPDLERDFDNYLRARAEDVNSLD